MKHRLQKLLAQANLGSRRATEDFITAGRVRVNGEVAILGTKADPEVDVVTLDGETLNLKTPPVYIAYYKPVNVLSTMERQPGDDRPTVREMIPVDGHLFSLGRLDVESEGLIVLTNDGELTNTLTHPRYEHTKTYQVTVYGTPDARAVERWERGVMLSEDDGTETQTAPCFVQVMRRDGDTAVLKVVMTEGRNRQIRRVAAMLGHPVKSLVRTHIGRFGLGRLKRGDYAEMSEQDLRLLTTPAGELEDIQKIKAQVSNQNRRAKFMALTSATPEQIEEAKRNKPAPAPRPGKKYRGERGAPDGESRGERAGSRRDDRGEQRSFGGRPRRTFERDDRRGGGRPDGKRPGAKPAFRSRLMLDETGESTPGARRHGQSDTPEGFRSRLGETDRRPRRPRTSDSSEGFRPRLSEADRTAARGEGRRPRGEGQDRPRRQFQRDGESRPPRRDGDNRPRRPRVEGKGDERPRRDDRREQRSSGERSASGDRPRRPFNREGGADRGEQRSSGRPPRRDGDSRPPRREGQDDRPRRPRPDGERGERSASGDRPRRPFNREGGEGQREQRSSGERSASGDRPQRPYNREGGEGRPPRRDGDSRPPRREGGDARSRDDRPRRPRPDGQGSSARSGGEQRSGRPPRRDDRREQQGSGDNRSRRPAPRPGGDKHPGSGERSSRPPRRDGAGGNRQGRPAGRDGDSRPPRRDSGDRPARPPKKRENDDE